MTWINSAEYLTNSRMFVVLVSKSQILKTNNLTCMEIRNFDIKLALKPKAIFLHILKKSVKPYFHCLIVSACHILVK